MVARELFSNETVRLWRDELITRRQAPFDVGDDAVMVAYAAQAELGCCLTLGWSLPANVIDLYAEHRAETNGLRLLCGNGLIGALAHRGLGHIDAGEKEELRRLIMGQKEWSDREKHDILDYCESDVVGLTTLMNCMASTIDLPRALLRGRYAASVARMQHAGVPTDQPLYRRLVETWEPLKSRIIAEIDADTAYSTERPSKPRALSNGWPLAAYPGRDSLRAG